MRAFAADGDFAGVRSDGGADGTNPINVTGGNTTDYDDGAWHYVAAVFEKDTANEDKDGSTDAKISLYIDPDSTTPLATGFHNKVFARSKATVDETNIGALVRQAGDVQAEFDGQIDEAAVYNSALTGEQVLTHYQTAVPEPTSLALVAAGGLMMLWPHRRRDTRC